MQGAATVDDVLNDDDVNILDVTLEVKADLNKAGGLNTCTVGRHFHKFHCAGAIDATDQVGGKKDRAFEYNNEHKFALVVGIVCIDLCREFVASRLNFFFICVYFMKNLEFWCRQAG